MFRLWALLLCIYLPYLFQSTASFVPIDAHVSDDLKLTPTILPAQGKVLVIGSGGFIGKYLVQRLVNEGYDVHHIYNRTHVDVRDASLFQSHIEGVDISFCFFLACEVGGSKYIGSENTHAQLDIIEHNMRIYQSVLPTLRARGIPYIFTSTYLQAQPTPYAAVKRLGEEWVKASNTQQMHLLSLRAQEKLSETSDTLLTQIASQAQVDLNMRATFAGSECTLGAGEKVQCNDVAATTIATNPTDPHCSDTNTSGSSDCTGTSDALDINTRGAANTGTTGNTDVKTTVGSSTIATSREMKGNDVDIDASAARTRASAYAGIGKMVRLWNIYGRERIGLRSHVVCDWLHQCHHQHHIHARSNGLEARQLLHGQDVARALVVLMRYFADIEELTDISSGEWITLRYLAHIIQTLSEKKSGKSCLTEFPANPADVRARISPRKDSILYRQLGWKPLVSLEDGLWDIMSALEQGDEALATIENNKFL